MVQYSFLRLRHEKDVVDIDDTVNTLAGQVSHDWLEEFHETLGAVLRPKGDM